MGQKKCIQSFNSTANEIERKLSNEVHHQKLNSNPPRNIKSNKIISENIDT